MHKLLEYDRPSQDDLHLPSESNRHHRLDERYSAIKPGRHSDRTSGACKIWPGRFAVQTDVIL